MITDSTDRRAANSPLSRYRWVWLCSERSSTLATGLAGFSICSSCSERDVMVMCPPGEGWNTAALLQKYT